MSGSLVLLSGGVDSTVALAQSEAKDTVSIFYGQRHHREIAAAAAVAEHYGARHDVVDLSSLAPHLRSALTTPSVEVPDGHYEAESMKATVVPNRNAIFIMVAAGVASSRGLREVVIGSHAGDHAIYPDCRPEFTEAASEAARLGCGVRVVAPFSKAHKRDIVKSGANWGAPFHLTWSCYRGGEAHCGTCGTCTERREAFVLAGVPDPTTYLA